MITRLKLENFRRHENTEIVLDPNDQIIAVSGKNGSGKSTLLEAIQFCLYGDTRHGRRGMDQLIRRGAEIEGMGVEMEFTVGDDIWKVIRRRDGKTGSAVLHANDMPMVEGHTAVTEAVAGLLGMDAPSFRLAAITQQKELDALIKMGPKARVKALGRLLRLDAVDRANHTVRMSRKKATDILQALPTPAVLEEVASEVAQKQEAVKACELAEAQSRSAIAELETKLIDAKDIDRQYRAARDAVSANQGKLESARAENQRLTSALEALVVPDIVEIPSSSEELRTNLSSIEVEIATAEANKALTEQREAIAIQLAQCEARIEAVVSELGSDTASSVEDKLAGSESLLRTAQQANSEAAEAVIQGRELEAQMRQQAEISDRKAVAAQELEGDCEMCGQEISEEHSHDFSERMSQNAEEASQAHASAVSSSATLGKSELSTLADVTSAEEVVATASVRLRTVAGLLGELEEKRNAKSLYEGQIERMSTVSVDLDVLYEQKGKLAVATAKAEGLEQDVRARENAVVRQADLASAKAESDGFVDDLQTQLVETQISAELQTRWDDVRQVAGVHTSELSMLTELATATTHARGELNDSKTKQDRNNADLERRSAYQHQGTVAAKASSLLFELEKQLGANIRPTLEGASSDLLNRLSEGRFTSVKLDNDFTPTVLDDGKHRQLGDLSGGEQDLVALAIRLSVSDVVGERSGAGVGFLILDEILGSQDYSRRESILSVLRSLRGRYGQIWCISHVGGIEDVADRVLEVEVNELGVSEVH